LKPPEEATVDDAAERDVVTQTCSAYHRLNCIHRLDNSAKVGVMAIEGEQLKAVLK
jgi:hypothetical protein